jgi:hypothetical protein
VSGPLLDSFDPGAKRACDHLEFFDASAAFSRAGTPLSTISIVAAAALVSLGRARDGLTERNAFLRAGKRHRRLAPSARIAGLVACYHGVAAEHTMITEVPEIAGNARRRFRQFRNGVFIGQPSKFRL